MATPTTKEPMVKMNMYFPKPFKDWLEEESAKTGLTKSAIVHIALKTYMDQQKSMEMLPKLAKVLQELEGKDQEVDPKAIEVIMKNIAKILGE